MKTITLFFLVIILFSCEDKGLLRYAHNEVYILDKREISVPLSKVIIKENEYLNNGMGINMPLNKCVKAKKYQLAINIAMENSLEETLIAFEKDTTLLTLSRKKSDAYNFILQKKDSTYIIRNIYVEKDFKMPIIMTFYTNDSAEIKNLYDKNSILKKILH
jgi:hypothetical protein